MYGTKVSLHCTGLKISIVDYFFKVYRNFFLYEQCYFLSQGWKKTPCFCELELQIPSRKSKGIRLITGFEASSDEAFSTIFMYQLLAVTVPTTNSSKEDSSLTVQTAKNSN